jgi:integrase
VRVPEEVGPIAYIVTRGKSYLVRWREPGTHKLVSESFHRKEDARSRRIDIERQIDRGEYSPQADRLVPFEVYLDNLLQGSMGLKQSTLYQQTAVFRKWVKGSGLGRTPIGKITTPQIRGFFAEARATAGPAALHNLYAFLRKGFNRAVSDGIFARSPLRLTDGERPKKRRAKPIQPLAIERVEMTAEAFRPEWRIAPLLAVYAGMRAGEIGGLREGDIDFFHDRLTIVQATSRAGGKRMIGSAKTTGSHRTITIPRFLTEEIAAHIAKNGVAEDGRLLRTAKGGYVEHIRLNDETAEACKRAGVPRVNFHLFRHTCVALLIKEGANPKQLQTYLGHSSIQITLDVYGHLFDAAGDQLAAKMGQAREKALKADAKVVPLPVRPASATGEG